MRPGQAVCRPVFLLVIGMSLLLSGCGNTSQSDLAKAKEQAADGNSAAKNAAPATALLGRSCGGSIRVGPKTSCAYAALVEAAFYSAGGGTNMVEVYVPATAKHYTMSCVAGVPSVCRGGKNAVVYIR